jgi:hypothetical protein
LAPPVERAVCEQQTNVQRLGVPRTLKAGTNDYVVNAKFQVFSVARINSQQAAQTRRLSLTSGIAHLQAQSLRHDLWSTRPRV